MAKKAQKQQVKEETPSLRFDHEGKTYEIVITRFNIIGRGVVTAQEALKDQALLAELVTIQSGVIKLIS